MVRSIAVIAALTWCGSCADPAVPTHSTSFAVEELDPPAGSRSRLPRWVAHTDETRSLSWVEETGNDTATLVFSRLVDDDWEPAREVARGDDWFVNWADFPSMAATDGEHLLAHFLQMSGAGTYDYRVQLVRSADGGKSWTEPVLLHTDSGPGEHGFVSLVPLDQDGLAAVWLDGRSAGSHEQMSADGAMCLYARTVAADGALGTELLLDDRVCDCCPTAAVRAADGAILVAYRDRSPDEVRDISVVRIEEGHASRPTWNSGDGWKIAGCPVNGPALCATGERIALAWFTLGSDGIARVQCAFSRDGGKTFSEPLTLAVDHTLGRVDAVFDASECVVVTWLEADAAGSRWRVARIDKEERLTDVHTAADATDSRDSGLARLASDSAGILFAWTETKPVQRVRTRRLVWHADSE